MLFYVIFLFFISMLLSIEYFYPKKQKVFSIAVFFVLVFISGFRDTIGTDYNRYVNWYVNKTRDDNFDFGFLLIMKLFRWLDLSYFFLFFFFSFFTCFFVFLGVKKFTNNSNLAILFYTIIPSLYLTSFTLVRQSFSVAISFYALYFLINKKYWIYFLLMFIGISIHYSCIIPFVFFFFIFIYSHKAKKNYLYAILIISFLLSRLNFFQIFKFIFEDTRYIYYFSDHYGLKVDWLKVVIMNIEGIFFLNYYEKLKSKFPYQQYLIVLYIFSIVFVNLFSKNYDMTRVSTYFRIFEIIVIADLVCLEVKRKRILLFLIFFVLYIAAYTNALCKDFRIHNETTPKYIPYKNILWQQVLS